MICPEKLREQVELIHSVSQIVPKYKKLSSERQMIAATQQQQNKADRTGQRSRP